MLHMNEHFKGSYMYTYVLSNPHSIDDSNATIVLRTNQLLPDLILPGHSTIDYNHIVS